MAARECGPGRGGAVDDTKPAIIPRSAAGSFDLATTPKLACTEDYGGHGRVVPGGCVGRSGAFSFAKAVTVAGRKEDANERGMVKCTLAMHMTLVLSLLSMPNADRIVLDNPRLDVRGQACAVSPIPHPHLPPQVTLMAQTIAHTDNQAGIDRTLRRRCRTLP